MSDEDNDSPSEVIRIDVSKNRMESETVYQEKGSYLLDRVSLQYGKIHCW